MRIEEWELFPGALCKQFVGRVFDHPRVADGTRMIVEAWGTRDGKILSRNDELWDVGQPHPEYEAAFPNARERVLKAMAEEEQRQGREAFQEGLDTLDRFHTEYKG